MTNEIELIERLASKHCAEIISGYTVWYLTSAILWTLIGIGLITIAVVLFRKLKDQNFIESLFASIALTLIGIALLSHNIATIIAPKAYATHKFIRDITGS